jgi:hypothetical protein
MMKVNKLRFVLILRWVHRWSIRSRGRSPCTQRRREASRGREGRRTVEAFQIRFDGSDSPEINCDLKTTDSNSYYQTNRRHLE